MNELKELNSALCNSVEKNSDVAKNYRGLAEMLARVDVAGEDECATAAILRRLERTLRDQADAVHECRLQLVRSMGRARGRSSEQRRNDGN